MSAEQNTHYINIHYIYSILKFFFLNHTLQTMKVDFELMQGTIITNHGNTTKEEKIIKDEKMSRY